MKMTRRWIVMAPLAMLGLVLFIAVGGEVVVHLWNWNLPQLFGWHQITFWQALGLFALCRILFGGFGVHGPARSRIRQRMAERWEHMTPEERERFQKSWRGRCGFGPSSREAQEKAPIT
jgi:hypothetical protein